MTRPLARLVRRRRGMSALQAVLIVGVALFVLTGVRQVWDAARADFTRQVARAVRGEEFAPGPGGGGGGGGGEDNTHGRPARPLTPIPAGATHDTATGAIRTTPDGGVENSAGVIGSASAAETARSMQAVMAALDRSDHGIVLVGGARDGGPDRFGGDFDHVLAVVRGADGSVRVLEMTFNGSNFMSSPNPPRVGLEAALSRYDAVQAVPLNNVTAAQAAAFVAEAERLTAPGRTYSINIGTGHTCASALETALIRAGILPRPGFELNGGFHDMTPHGLLDLVAGNNRAAATPAP